MRTDVRTETGVTKLIVALCNFANAPEDECVVGSKIHSLFLQNTKVMGWEDVIKGIVVTSAHLLEDFIIDILLRLFLVLTVSVHICHITSKIVGDPATSC
jgi:hypothetical protein